MGCRTPFEDFKHEYDAMHNRYWTNTLSESELKDCIECFPT